MPVPSPADAAPLAAATAIASAPTEDAAAPDAGARAPRPVVVRAFRKVPGSSDVVSPRAPKPDGEPDAVFELVVEGDVAGLALWNTNLSMSAVAEPARPPAPERTGPVPLPPARTEKPAPWARLKHVPALYVFEDGKLAGDDEGNLALPAHEGRRTLRLHTWRPLDGGGKGPWRLVVLAADGRDREAPSLP